MRLPLRGLSDAELLRTHRAAQDSLDSFGRAIRQHGSLIQSWVAGADVVALEHYPEGGVVDRRRGSQCFYHSHRAADAEHGHLHLFWHATRTGRRRRLGTPGRPGRGDWARTAPSHLIAIGLDARGLPVSLFSVNHWVADGHWFDADTTLGMVRRFELKGIAGHVDSSAWVTAFVRLYEPVIDRVLRARDRRIAAQPCPAAALGDRRIEVLSTARLDWLADLARIDHELKRRGLEPVTCPAPRSRGRPTDRSRT
jgi:hypothetical protein